MTKILCIAVLAAAVAAAAAVPAHSSAVAVPAVLGPAALAPGNVPSTLVLTAAKATRDNTYDVLITVTITLLGPQKSVGFSGDAARMTLAQRSAAARAAFD